MAQPAPAAANPAPAPVTPVVAKPAPAKNEDEPAAVAQTYDVKKAFGAIARIHTAVDELTPQQRARLDALIQRYTKRTRKSKEYTIEHREHMADPRVVNGFRPLTKELTYQIVIERSRGSKHVGPRRQRVRRRAPGLRHEPVRLAARLPAQGDPRAGRPRLRDRTAARRSPARPRSCSATSPVPSAPRSATPAPRP